MKLTLSNECFLSRKRQKNDHKHFHESGREKKVHVKKKSAREPKNTYTQILSVNF